MSFHDHVVDIKNCKNERELLKVVSNLTQNQARLKLDDSDMQRLEDIGMKRYEEIQRDRSSMIRNKKQGFNNVGE